MQKLTAENECLPSDNSIQPQPSVSYEPLRTPVTSTSLHALRVKVEQNLYKLDEETKVPLLKMANAAERAITDRVLLFDENRLLFEQNNEKMTRDSVKPTVVGKAKIMCFDDIVEAQNKREKKEMERANRKRKRKVSAAMPSNEERSRAEEMENARRDIANMGLSSYCSVLEVN